MECDSSLVNLMYYQAQELVSNENILLQTLGFDVAIDHPHTHVVKCCQLVKGPLLLFFFFIILDGVLPFHYSKAMAWSVQRIKS